MEKILITGGAGYIGSHTCLELIEKGYDVAVVDNLANGNIEAVHRIKEMTGKNIPFFEIDIRDYQALKNLLKGEKIQSVIHFAGYKAVGESVRDPLLYYSNNVAATVSLLRAMKECKINKIVFSSSCTVYGEPDSVPVKESDNKKPTNPYGQSKLMIEQILEDCFNAYKDFSVSVLRYFNPIGAHPSGKIGEDPKGIPNNLIPYVCKVAAGKLDELQVFGSDYETKDGTCVRDYIHVVDLARAHILALEEITNNRKFEIYNIGTGVGYSVLDVIEMFEKVAGQQIPYNIIGRRPGDVAKTFADPSKANAEMGWRAEKGLKEMCVDSWNWQTKNPSGYNLA